MSVNIESHTPSLAKALLEAQKEFSVLVKREDNPYFKSKYADLSACIDAVLPHLNKNGIFVMQATTEHDYGVIVETTFVHESGESLSAGKLFVPAAKKDAQGFGSALTYARRYSLMAACCIAAEDDDGNAASGNHVNQKDGYNKYSQENLQTLREAALLGSEDLKKAFTALTPSVHKNQFWEEHKESLKKAAALADQQKSKGSPCPI